VNDVCSDGTVVALVDGANVPGTVLVGGAEGFVVPVVVVAAIVADGAAVLSETAPSVVESRHAAQSSTNPATTVQSGPSRITPSWRVSEWP
jgi:hypothetical protein